LAGELKLKLTGVESMDAVLDEVWLDYLQPKRLMRLAGFVLF
jgi:hypothetical protein